MCIGFIGIFVMGDDEVIWNLGMSVIVRVDYVGGWMLLGLNTVG